MATGKSGYFDIAGNNGITIRVNWEETYTIETNTSIVTVTGVSLKSSTYRTSYFLNGNISVADSPIVEMSSVMGTHVVDIPTLGSFESVVATTNAGKPPWSSGAIEHNADGSRTVTIAVNLRGYTSSGGSGNGWTVSGSTAVTLTTIPRASSLSASNGTLDTAQTLTINRAVTSFKHRITYTCGSTSGYITPADGFTTAASVSWTPPIGLASENTAGTSVSITLTLRTYTAAGDYIGTSSKTITCTIPAKVKPSCTIKVTDPTGNLTYYGYAVQGLSKLKVDITAQTSYGSAIAQYTTDVGGTKYSGQSITTGILESDTDVVVTSTVKDKRGRSGSSDPTTVGVLAYTPPTVNKLKVERCNQDGTANDRGEYVKVTFSAAVTRLNGKNTAAYTLKHKTPSASQYTSVAFSDIKDTYAVTNKTYIFPVDSSSSCEIVLAVKDRHHTTERATSASTAFTLINFHPTGTSIGFGKVCENTNNVEFGMSAKFEGDVYGKAYGFGALPAIPQNADLNDYFEIGCYSVRQNVVAETIKNIPVDVAGRLYVSAATGLEGDADPNALYAYREQRYVPYLYGCINYDYGAWIRYAVKNNSTEWTLFPWFNEALKAYPIGSIHLRYDTKNPADLFGGTWVQITARVLRAGSAGSVGGEGGLADGSARTYVDVAVWRRTA